jgi:hypothetical protein
MRFGVCLSPEIKRGVLVGNGVFVEALVVCPIAVENDNLGPCCKLAAIRVSGEVSSR